MRIPAGGPPRGLKDPVLAAGLPAAAAGHGGAEVEVLLGHVAPALSEEIQLLGTRDALADDRAAGGGQVRRQDRFGYNDGAGVVDGQL